MKYCIDQGHQVFGVDINHTSTLALKPRGANYRVDISNSNAVNNVFEDVKPDVVFSLAAYASEGRSNHIRSFIHSNNTVGTANVINACVNHKCKLVFTSSVAVYSLQSGEPPFTEEMTPHPIDDYGISKFCSEMSIKVAGETQGLDWCIIRPRNVYGPGQSLWDRSRNLFGIWCYNALHNMPLTIFGDGLQGRSFTYIDDIIPCLYRAKDVSNEIINLGSNDPWTIVDAAIVFCEITGCKNIIHTESRHEVKEAYCRILKSVRLLGYKNNTELESGLSRMWEWAKQQPERPFQEMPALETTTNAHSSLK
jgi:UDP-glucose 4-epimerase